MTYLIPSTNLVIDDNLNIRTKHGESVILTRPTPETVNLYLFGQFRKNVNLKWLYTIARYDINDHRVYTENVEFSPVEDGTKRKGFRIFVSQRAPWYADKDGIYRIPVLFPSVAVSAAGVVVDAKTLKRYPYWRDHNNYYRVSLQTSSGSRSVSIHRLVAYAWVDNPHPSLYDIVNHIDSDRTNNRARNLEWTNDAGNVRHAVHEGKYRVDCVKCSLRDRFTREVHTFPSISEAWRFLGKTSVNIVVSSVKDQALTKLIDGTYEIRVGDDTRPWFYNTLDAVEVRGEGSRSKFVTTLNIDGKLVKYLDTRLIVKDFKLWNMHAYKDGKNTIEAILARLVEENPQIKVVSVEDQAPIRKVQYLNALTGATAVYDSAREAERTLGVSKSNILISIKSDGAKAILGEYRFRVLPQDPNAPWPEIEARKFAPMQMMIFDTVTGQTQTCKSLREVHAITNIARTTLSGITSTEWVKVGNRFKLRRAN